MTTALSSTPLRPPPEPATRQAAICFEQVTCRFAGAKGAEPYTAISEVDLEIGASEFVAVVGPTGCGKSTLLNVASGLLTPSSGRVSIFGKPLPG